MCVCVCVWLGVCVCVCVRVYRTRRLLSTFEWAVGRRLAGTLCDLYGLGSLGVLLGCGCAALLSVCICVYTHTHIYIYKHRTHSSDLSIDSAANIVSRECAWWTPPYGWYRDHTTHTRKCLSGLCLNCSLGIAHTQAHASLNLELIVVTGPSVNVNVCVCMSAMTGRECGVVHVHLQSLQYRNPFSCFAAAPALHHRHPLTALCGMSVLGVYVCALTSVYECVRGVCALTSVCECI